MSLLLWKLAQKRLATMQRGLLPLDRFWHCMLGCRANTTSISVEASAETPTVDWQISFPRYSLWPSQLIAFSLPPRASADGGRGGLVWDAASGGFCLYLCPLWQLGGCSSVAVDKHTYVSQTETTRKACNIRLEYRPGLELLAGELGRLHQHPGFPLEKQAWGA